MALAAERALRELDAAISSSLELSEMSDDPASAQVSSGIVGVFDGQCLRHLSPVYVKVACVRVWHHTQAPEHQSGIAVAVMLEYPLLYYRHWQQIGWLQRQHPKPWLCRRR